jgi:ribose transport system permease protein
MSASSAPAATSVVPRRLTISVTLLRRLLPAASFVILLGVIIGINRRAGTYLGLTLLLNLAVPLVLATLSQMMVIAVNDNDLSVGAFVGFVACVGAVWMATAPWFTAGILLAAVLVYAILGALIQLRRLPALAVTLGMSFVWYGFAVLLLPSPGGHAPVWLLRAMAWRPILVPLPLLISLVLGLGMNWLVIRSSMGVLLRGAGGNPRALIRSNWSLLAIRSGIYAAAGLLAVLAGVALLGLATSGDANMAGRYTLLSIAGVILGGGEFTGGLVSPIGAVFGALSLSLVSSLLTFLNISTDWQVGSQGVILILVLGLRALLQHGSETEGPSA